MIGIRSVFVVSATALMLGSCSEQRAVDGAMTPAVTPPKPVVAAAAGVGGGAGLPGSTSALASAGTASGGVGGMRAPEAGASAGTGELASAGRAGTTAGAGAAAGSRGPSAAGAAAGPCELPDPPDTVAAWVDASWDAELGRNIRTREAWILDHVLLNQGALNLCVRWGATSAVPAMVNQNLEITIQRWFHDWFEQLTDYDCFPYGTGIQVKVTGWAVRPGKEALLAAVDSSLPVYTELDKEGEPKCPDACSSFVHWDHDFAKCPGGADNHTDYWLWFDDKLPGDGGAAAVGGDWGLRMPVKTFLDAFDKPSDNIVEHEMGHGFGFQDYYTWTGPKPEGGSLMIVGSSDDDAPTLGDRWLLRRTWRELKRLRGY